MANICIIPARGGSKRIPRKNIKPFCGKPIIAYSIEAALSSKLFDEVMVSTEDEEIAELSLQYGAKVPFLRTIDNADDHATTSDVILEVLSTYKNEGKIFDLVCCCYATAPLIASQKLKEGLSLLLGKNASVVFPILEYSYPIQRCLKLTKENRLSMNWIEFINTRSQDLEKLYHDAGQWYWIKAADFMREKKILMNNTFGLIVNPLEAHDIDNETDWRIAEFKYEYLQGTKHSNL
jgi:N-acylneuraminate cytidylyltransferase